MGLSQDDALGYQLSPSATVTNCWLGLQGGRIKPGKLKKKIHSFWLRCFPVMIFVFAVD